jgi:hypothetical protein
VTQIYKKPRPNPRVFREEFHSHESQLIHADYPRFSVYVADGNSASAV